MKVRTDIHAGQFNEQIPPGLQIDRQGGSQLEETLANVMSDMSNTEGSITSNLK